MWRRRFDPPHLQRGGLCLGHGEAPQGEKLPAGIIAVGEIPSAVVKTLQEGPVPVLFSGDLETFSQRPAGILESGMWTFFWPRRWTRSGHSGAG
jgi:hypothetical protein